MVTLNRVVARLRSQVEAAVDLPSLMKEWLKTQTGKLAKLPADERALIQTLCEQYRGGKRITRKQLAKADLEAEGETSMWEILATRIKVLKEMSRSELVPIRY